MKKLLQLLLVSFAVDASAADSARVPAFPGAEGAGAYAKGGRGGRVIYVTNLQDSGPGSLRDAVAAKGPRTVLFKVSGNIELKKAIRVEEPLLTVAGQSAPGDGICLKNAPFQIAAHDVIVRYLRVRPGDVLKKEMDVLSMATGSRDVIVDHCSASWSTDEVLSVSGTNINNVTVQWCIISESLNKSVHDKGSHGYGSLIRADGDVTYHHNIYAHHSSRNPRPGSYGVGRGLLLDFRNNVIYDWGSRAGYTSEDPATINYVGNYLKPGPSTTRKNEAFNIGGAATKMYAADNAYHGNAALGADNWKMISDVLPGTRVAKPYSVAPVKTDTAAEAFEKVLTHAGASRPKRDPVDTRIISQIRDGKGRIIDSQTQVGGWPALKSATPATDSDGDGMPDAWEAQQKLNPKDAADGALIGKDGYTNLENFLNSLL